MEPTATTPHAGNFLSRVLDPLAHALNREAAESILNTKIDPEVQARVAVLAERANEGELTPDEHDEYLSYVEAADTLALFKLKARQHLNGNGPGWAGAGSTAGTTSGCPSRARRRCRSA